MPGKSSLRPTAICSSPRAARPHQGVPQGKDGTIISTNIFAEHLRQPFGIAFYPPDPTEVRSNVATRIPWPLSVPEGRPSGAWCRRK